MAVVRRDLGPRSPWGRFRLAVERFDAILFELLARRRSEQTPGDSTGDSMLSLLLSARDEHGNAPSDRHVRDQLVALLVGLICGADRETSGFIVGGSAAFCDPRPGFNEHAFHFRDEVGESHYGQYEECRGLSRFKG